VGAVTRVDCSVAVAELPCLALEIPEDLAVEAHPLAPRLTSSADRPSSAFMVKETAAVGASMFHAFSSTTGASRPVRELKAPFMRSE